MDNFHSNWSDYELIDCGSFEKLERFGKYILIRPEQAAKWNKHLSSAEWLKAAHAKYHETTKSTGSWEKYKKMPDTWDISYKIDNKDLYFNLKLKDFKHIGVFPEQEENWAYIYNTIKKVQSQKLKVLNLFAYTGGASMAASKAGADVTHIESLKQNINWTKENMASSDIDNIRLLIDDAIKFVGKEIKRKSIYNGIIMDPPTFGIGAKGERWSLKKDFETLLSLVNQIIDKNLHFMVINTYTYGFNKADFTEIVKSSLPSIRKFNIEKIFLKDKFNNKLPAGIVLRAENNC